MRPDPMTGGRYSYGLLPDGWAVFDRISGHPVPVEHGTAQYVKARAEALNREEAPCAR